MLTRPSIDWIFSACIIICVQNAITLKQSSWLKNFVNYVNNEKSIHQLLLLFDTNRQNGDRTIQDIVHEVSANVASLKIRFKEATNEKAEELSRLPSLYNPRITMITIIDLAKNTQNMSKVYSSIEFLSRISEARSRFQCLIILPQEQEKNSYKKLLQDMWTSQFLDATILELLEENSGLRSHVLNFQQSLIFSQEAMIHQFNPFTKMYLRIRYSSKVSWFPKKSDNLRGHAMKVGLINFPPSAIVERNNAGQVTNVGGIGVSLVEVMSKALNFRPKWIMPRKDLWSSGTCNKEETVGIVQILVKNQIQLIGFENGRYDLCEESFFEWARALHGVQLVMVIPTSPKSSPVLLTKWKIGNALVLVSLFSLIWIFSRVMRFDSSIWSPDQMIRIVLGLSTPREPREVIEQIVFGSLLICCMLNSGYIYTAFTDIRLQSESLPEFENISDVLSSNLEPIIEASYAVAFQNTSNYQLHHLMLKSRIVQMGHERCIKRLIKYRNVTCVMRRDVAEWLTRDERDDCGRPLTKILNEPLASTGTGWPMKAGSPFLTRFDEVMQILIQSGIVEKFHAKSRFIESSVMVSTEDSCRIKNPESVILQRQITYVLFVGYASATLVFIFEVIYAYLENKYLKDMW